MGQFNATAACINSIKAEAKCPESPEAMLCATLCCCSAHQPMSVLSAPQNDLGCAYAMLEAQGIRNQNMFAGVPFDMEMDSHTASPVSFATVEELQKPGSNVYRRTIDAYQAMREKRAANNFATSANDPLYQKWDIRVPHVIQTTPSVSGNLSKDNIQKVWALRPDGVWRDKEKEHYELIAGGQRKLKMLDKESCKCSTYRYKLKHNMSDADKTLADTAREAAYQYDSDMSLADDLWNREGLGTAHEELLRELPPTSKNFASELERQWRDAGYRYGYFDKTYTDLAEGICGPLPEGPMKEMCKSNIRFWADKVGGVHSGMPTPQINKFPKLKP